jgi:hypothetical protein
MRRGGAPTRGNILNWRSWRQHLNLPTEVAGYAGLSRPIAISCVRLLMRRGWHGHTARPVAISRDRAFAGQYASAVSVFVILYTGFAIIACASRSTQSSSDPPI